MTEVEILKAQIQALEKLVALKDQVIAQQQYPRYYYNYPWYSPTFATSSVQSIPGSLTQATINTPYVGPNTQTSNGNPSILGAIQS